MPPPPVCTFRGTAAEVHITGEGPAVLTRREAFSAPHASRVELRGAQVGSSKPGSIDRPAQLTPVNDHPSGPYDVTFFAGPPVVVSIDVGGKPGPSALPSALDRLPMDDDAPRGELDLDPYVDVEAPAGVHQGFVDVLLADLLLGELALASHDPGNRVAIKMLHDPGGGFAERFRRECLFYTKLRHPNVVRMLRAGETSPMEGSVMYLVMDLVEGITLRRLLQKSATRRESAGTHRPPGR